MLVYGISNRLISDKFLFFYEFDNVDFKDVLAETKKLSNMFAIDIAILESSKNSYHLVSFDVLEKEYVKRICNHVSIESDFICMDMQKLWGNTYEDNCLRLGKKFSKGNPRFIAWVKTKEHDRYIAINHLRTYSAFCGVPVPNYPEFLKIPYRVYFVIYCTGVRRKRWQGGLRRKEYSRL